MKGNERWALITGVSQGGLGDALTTELLARNINVIATNIRIEDMEYLSSTPSSSQDARLEKLQLDVTDLESIATARDATAKLTGGKLDFLFNNAGYGYMMPLLDCSIEGMRKNFDVNVFGLLAVTQALFPLLREAGGVVVNQSSIAVCWFLSFLSLVLHSLFARLIEVGLARLCRRRISLSSGVTRLAKVR